MEVFLVPLAADRYELYCEVSPEEDSADGEERQGRRTGWFAGLRAKFSEAMAAAEQDRLRRENGEADSAPRSTLGRLKARGLAWIADAIAEQRLLWRLRHEEAAQLHFPSDITAERAESIMRGALTRDRDRHRFWLCIDAILMIASGLLILVPGPNLIGYYFAFRVVGHFLSWRGARNGLDCVKWEFVASEPLAELRRAMTLAPTQRERRLVDIATRLRLDHLATFVERVAWPTT
jgi:Mitochondrial K+-H+ exchange-related